MLRYRNNPAANEAAFYNHDGQRYFRTGDIGKMVDGKVGRSVVIVLVYVSVRLINWFVCSF